MSFPLADWVLDHPGVRHNLALSGLVGALRTLPRTLRHPMPPDAEALRAAIARSCGVPGRAVFLTHGATEANALVLLALARTGGRVDRPRRIYVPTPEYPPLRDAAAAIGFRCVARPASAEGAILSRPNNPTGAPVPETTLRALAESIGPTVVDETFREFTETPSVAHRRHPGIWVTGSFTKVYGADDLRIGFAIAPPGGEDGFARLHGLLLDRLSAVALSGGRAILRDRATILREGRALFQRNLRTLRERIDGIGPVAAPVWFHRGPPGLDGDALARRLLRQDILVCSGAFFGERAAIRIALTRRSFPADLDAYLAGRRPR